MAKGRSEADISDLATKSDLAALRSELSIDMAELKSELFRFMMLQAVTIVGLTVTLI